MLVLDANRRPNGTTWYRLREKETQFTVCERTCLTDEDARLVREYLERFRELANGVKTEARKP